MENEEGSYPLPTDDDVPVALPPSKGVHPGHLWVDGKTEDFPEKNSSSFQLESEEASDGDIEGQLKYQHRKVLKKLDAHEQMLKKVLISIRSLAFQSGVGAGVGAKVSPVSSSRYSQSSSGGAGVGRVASLRSYGGSRNPRSLDIDMKVESETKTGWEKFKPAPDPISEGVDGSGHVSHASSSPTIFKSYTAFDLGLKEEAQATQGERTRRKYASLRMQFGLTSKGSKRTIEQVQQATSNAIRHPAFDAFFAVVVFANAIFTGIEVESSISGGILSDAQIRVSHYIFFSLFTIELVARVCLHGRRFFCSDDWLWNWLDIAIVASSFVEIIMDIITEQQASDEFEGRNPMSGLKVFRIIRLTRLVKTIRLVRIFRFVVALRTLVTSILHTLKALFWALTLLGLIVYVFAVLFAQAVYDHRADPEMPALNFEEDRAAIRYFGSLAETMLSLFMSIAGGVSWQEVLAPLKAMDLMWVFLFLFYVSFTYFAVLNVVTGVFCQSAIENAQNDHAAVVQNILDNKESHLRKIKALFSKLGADDSGIITYEMLHEQFGTPAVREYFESLGLDISDAWSFFKLLDMDGGGAVEVEEFLLGCLRLRGQARAMDMAKLMFDQTWLIKSQGQFQTFVETELLRLNSQVGRLAETTGVNPGTLPFC